MADLTSVPTRVESPFVIVKIGNYTFGQATRNTSGNYLNVTFPNIVQSLSVTKLNGEVNTYNCSLTYQIQVGDDPNMLDKIFSADSGARDITFSYGDWSAPGYIYKEEEAIITNLTSSVDFSGSRISYSITAVSKSFNSLGAIYSFPAREEKASGVLFQLLRNSNYGLTDIFKGMKNIAEVIKSGLIATNDAVVKLQAQPQMSLWDYLKYVVSCMSSSDGKYTYLLSVVDDVKNKFNGSYFKVTPVSKSDVPSSINQDAYYTIDVGVGDLANNYITSFSLRNTNQYTILYNNAVSIPNTYQYKFDRYGEIKQIYAPGLMRSSATLQAEQNDKNWWDAVTSFPITANITIKGLIRPSILMDHVYINSYFYGQKHISSGLYIITKEEDEIGGGGYKTTLTLLRIGNDSFVPSKSYTNTGVEHSLTNTGRTPNGH